MIQRQYVFLVTEAEEIRRDGGAGFGFVRGNNDFTASARAVEIISDGMATQVIRK